MKGSPSPAGPAPRSRRAGRGAFLLLAALAVLGWAAPLSAALVSVAVPPEAQADGPRVLLGQVAFIDILPQSRTSPARQRAAEELARALAGVDLGAAPAAGQSTVWRRAQLEHRLSSSGLNLTETAFSLPEELTVTGRSQRLSEAVLRRALEKYLAENEPYRGLAHRLVSVNFGTLPTLPPGRVGYRFVPQASSNPINLAGAFHFAVDGQPAGRARVTAQVELSLEVVTAARPLPRGQVLAERDLVLMPAPYSQAKGALTEIAPAVGQTLKVALDPGEALRERHLTKSVIVRRGDRVTIVAEQGGLKVTAAGLARQDGALGETITVTNISSKKNLTGRVAGPGQVEIVF